MPALNTSPTVTTGQNALASGLEVALLGLGDTGDLAGAVAELEGGVAVRAGGGLALEHDVGAELDHRDAVGVARRVEHLRHANLAADEAHFAVLTHVYLALDRSRPEGSLDKSYVTPGEPGAGGG